MQEQKIGHREAARHRNDNPLTMNRQERQNVTRNKGKVNRSTTDRLKRLIEAELDRQNLTDEEAAREARLPGNAFRALRKGHRPSIDRADELCTALGISMTIGVERNPTDRSRNHPDAAGADPGTGYRASSAAC